MRKYGAWLGFCLLLAFIIGQSVASAIGKEEKINKEEVFETIRKGYEAQYSIRGKHLSVEKMYDILTPYITDNFLQVFTDENSSDTKGGGSYLLDKKPPFSFSASTKIGYDKENGLLYVYERINKETPVHEVVILQKAEGKWKVGGYNSYETLPAEIQKLEKE